MAKGAYVGVAGVARKVKSQYVGVAGVARKVKKAYAGVAGVAKLCWWGVQTVSVPTQNGTLTYSGSAKSPAWSGYDSGTMTIGGTTSATEAGSYTATFTLKTGYQWVDGTTEKKSVMWTIGVRNILVPFAVSSNIAYTGNEQACPFTWDSAYISASGDTRATAVGTYNVTFSLKNKNSTRFTIVASSGEATYTIDDQTVLWTISEIATPAFSISPSAAARSVAVGSSISWTVTTNSDGLIYAKIDGSSLSDLTSAEEGTSTNASGLTPVIATVSVNGSIVTAKGLTAGKGTIEIGVNATSAYKAASKTVSLTVTESGGGDVSI